MGQEDDSWRPEHEVPEFAVLVLDGRDAEDKFQDRQKKAFPSPQYEGIPE